MLGTYQHVTRFCLFLIEAKPIIGIVARRQGLILDRRVDIDRLRLGL
jgi:hypothetical protein